MVKVHLKIIINQNVLYIIYFNHKIWLCSLNLSILYYDNQQTDLTNSLHVSVYSLFFDMENSHQNLRSYPLCIE